MWGGSRFVGAEAGLRGRRTRMSCSRNEGHSYQLQSWGDPSQASTRSSRANPAPQGPGGGGGGDPGGGAHSSWRPKGADNGGF